MCGTHRSQGFKVSTALTGTRQEVQEKTVYIYLTHQHFGEACVWASEARVADLLSSASSAVNMRRFQICSKKQIEADAKSEAKNHTDMIVKRSAQKGIYMNA